MPTFTCRKCKHALSVERMPHSCPRCYSPAKEAYEGSQRSGVHRRFDTGEHEPQGGGDDESWAEDVGGSLPSDLEIRSAQPRGRKRGADTSEHWPPPPGLEDVPTDPYALRGGPLRGIDRGELEEEDIEDAVAGGLVVSDTQELAEADLEPATDPGLRSNIKRGPPPPPVGQRRRAEDAEESPDGRPRAGTLPFGIAFSPESGPPLGSPGDAGEAGEDESDRSAATGPQLPPSRGAQTGPQLPDRARFDRRQFPSTQPMPPVSEPPRRQRRTAPTRRQRRLPTSQNERLMESVKKDQRRRWSGLVWAAVGALVAFAVFRVMGVNEQRTPTEPRGGPVFPTAKGPIDPSASIAVADAAPPAVLAADASPPAIDLRRDSAAPDVKVPVDAMVSADVATQKVDARPRVAVAPKPRPKTTVKPRPKTTVKPRPKTTVKPRPKTTAKPKPETVAKKTITAEDKAAALAAYGRGIRALLMGKASHAAAQFKGALAKNAKLARAYRGLGLAYEKSGKAGKARKAFGQYLRMAPSAPDAPSIRKRMKKL